MSLNELESKRKLQTYEDLYNEDESSHTDKKQKTQTNLEDGEIAIDKSKRNERGGTSDDKYSRKSSQNEERKKDNERSHNKEKERRRSKERAHSKERRSRSRERPRSRERKEKERYEKYRNNNEKEREREKDRYRSEKNKERERSVRNETSRSKDKPDSAQPIQEVPIKSQEDIKKEEEEYKQRVLQQMQELSKKEDDEEEIIRKRRERRKQLVANLQVGGENSNLPSSAPSTPTPIQIDNLSLQASPLLSVPTPPPTVIQEEKNKSKDEDSFDIFADIPESKVESPKTQGEQPFEPKERDTNEVDIFAGDLDENNDGLVVGQVPKVAPKASRADMSEVTDDAEGYYCYRMGEVLNKKYVVLGSYGKGVFSTVLRAKEQTTDKDVAIKVLRNNEAMKRMGFKEIQILKDLANHDPQNKHNVIRLLDSFEDREHLCLVFEPMTGGNLREVLKKYGHHIGLSIKAVKFYAHKMLQSLKLLKKTQIIHADIKLDNILVNDSKTQIKLGDFGSASPITENQITPYLVSRFYRAPEIVLGLTYGYPIDMWSVACCIYEIATGKILFPGRSNNEMLFLYQEVGGPFSRKMIKKGLFAKNHFDERGAFRRIMHDKMTGREYLKLYNFTKPTRDLKEDLLRAPYEINAEEKKMILQLFDLLSQMLALDPGQRISIEEALRHPFFTSTS